MNKKNLLKQHSARLKKRVAKVGRWVAKLVARMLAKPALWVRIQTLKNKKWTTFKQSSGNTHTLARQKIYKKNEKT
jgi:hypothetical protein